MFLDVSESAEAALRATAEGRLGREVAQGRGLKPWLHRQNHLGSFKAATSGPALLTLI